MDAVIESITPEAASTCGTIKRQDKLIAEIAKHKGRPKDEDFKASLAEESTPSLWDRYQSVQSREAGTPAE